MDPRYQGCGSNGYSAGDTLLLSYCMYRRSVCLVTCLAHHGPRDTGRLMRIETALVEPAAVSHELES